ncbi:MAG TPA: hypothetical protein VGR28_04180 [Candidatus Thermoplasmatota archaeon]|nr:hypothetical protein [Candidatus Thermoplasmatota archaeon]
MRRIGPEKGEHVLDLRPGAVVADALRAAGIVPDTVLVARAADKQVVPDDEPVAEGETLLVTRVVTGG